MRAFLCLLGLLCLPALARANDENCDVYYFGIGQRPDHKRALDCMMAEDEHRRDWLLLGVMYLNGEGTPRDLAKAREALMHRRKQTAGFCDASCGALDEAIRRQAASPQKPIARIDYCKDMAQARIDWDYCLGIKDRKAESRRKGEERSLAVDASPEVKKRMQALSKAFAKFKDSDGMREYQNFKDGTIRGEAASTMEARVSKHYKAALAAWGPKASAVSTSPRPLADADRELNAIYRDIMDGLNQTLDEAKAEKDAAQREARVQSVTEVKNATREAERAWLRYAEAWKALVKELRPDGAAALDDLRAFLTEQRIRELKYSSIGEPGSLDPEE